MYSLKLSNYEILPFHTWLLDWFNAFERCCDDNMICFSNTAHRIDNKRLSIDELKDLFYDMRGINFVYHLPSYDGNHEFNIFWKGKLFWAEATV